MMHIQLTEEDYWEMNKFAMFKLYGKGMLIAVCVLPVAIAIIFRQLDFSWIQATIAALLCSIFANGMTYIRTKRKIKKLARESKGILGGHQLEITEQEIRWSNDMTSGVTQWKGLESFNETKQYFFIFINKASAHVIPKRSFETEAEAVRFAEQVRTYMKTAQHNT
ncbi:YcxB family protein [Paenibacillus sp. FSL R5-0519]|uniref:YcxB family protein n=1 Tax=Paenibacillus sp. FSL R5-0519 TaxID=2921648 RepID=UPI0030D9011D